MIGIKLCKEYDIKAKIPPTKKAAEHPKIDYMSDRDAAIRLCGKDGVKEWKKEMGKDLMLKVFSQG